ncbi:hypothetical protein C6P40_000819 [Pichia californica]|uniref:Uncharacterized protein n=1 Tax=Pichia californica TaxID=460514 RepID=A0A9P7BGQ4_9ASCO|nr:hypothetical protein C6P40_000819 [[Candida] californica]
MELYHVSAEEVDINEFPTESFRMRASMYFLLTSYKLHPKLSHKYALAYGTDFTDASKFARNNLYFDHCKLRDGSSLDRNMIVTIDASKSEIDNFTKYMNLPPAKHNPNNNIYDMKIIVEVRGIMKRYKRLIDFQYCEIYPLLKTDILSKIRIHKDTHLIEFFLRLQENCPTSWKNDLNTKYGLNDLIDDIGSEFDDFPLNTQAGLQSHTEFRLLNEMPDPIQREKISRLPLNIQQISNMILKTEDAVISPDISELNELSQNEISPPLTKLPTNTKEIPIPRDKPHSYTSDISQCSSEGSTELEADKTNYVNEFDHSPERQEPEKDEIIGYKEAYICGYSPNGKDSMLIKCTTTAKYILNDSFEVYLRLEPTGKEIYTLAFRKSEDLWKILSPNKNAEIPELSSKHESSIINAISEKFSKGSIIKIPLDIYKKFVEGSHYAHAPSYAENAPEYFLYE